MKPIAMLLATALLAAAAAAEEKLQSSLLPGKPIAMFHVVKCAGAEEDGVKPGQSLCYCCKYGARPLVIVFARRGEERLAALVKELDKLVARHESKQLSAFVSLLDADQEKAEDAAFNLGKHSEHVPLVVPAEYKNGPKHYGIHPQAQTTVILAKAGKVLATHALPKDGLNAKAIKAILADVKKLTH